MKSIPMLLIVLAGLACSSFSQTNPPAKATESDYPITGMTAIDLASCINEIKLLLPVGPKIVNISIKNESKVTITTITTEKVTGPLSGGGDMITFEKKNGKWVETSNGHWVS